MPAISRLIAACMLISSMIIGCQAAPAQAPTPATQTSVTVSSMLPAATSTPPVSMANMLAFSASEPGTWESQIKLIQQDGRIGPPISNTTNAAISAWSPDGKRIAYIVHRSNSNWSLVVVDADGQNLQQLTQGNLDYSPSWSPDGAQIAFSRNGNLWVMRVSNDSPSVASDLRQITTDPKRMHLVNCLVT